jgi:hypothetical protein
MLKHKIKSGETIIIDDENLNQIKQFSWEFIYYKDKPRVVKCKDQRQQLLCLLFPENKGKSIEFKNGNHLDYRKENIVAYFATKSQISLEEKLQQERLKKIKEVYIPENDCTVVAQPRRSSDLLCCTCAYVDGIRYSNCLDVASNHFWDGWKPKSGKWCQQLKETIQKQQDAEASRSGYENMFS